jgi:hypothetical protein
MGFYFYWGFCVLSPLPTILKAWAEQGHESISRNCWSDQLDSPWILQLQFHHSPRLQKHLTYKAFMCISGGGERPWWSWQQLYKPTSTMLSRTDILLSLQTQDRSPCSSKYITLETLGPSRRTQRQKGLHDCRSSSCF